MALTASFSEVRQNLTSITDRVARENVEVTVFKRSKPAFRIVPVGQEEQGRGTLEGRLVDWKSAPDMDEAARRELFDQAMALRERGGGTTGSNGTEPEGMSALAAMTVEDMKRELANRV